MRITAALLVAFTVLVAFALEPGKPQAQSAVALSGQVTSAEEGAMEGVVVSAKKDGSTITISVVTDAQGRYAFPAARLEPGKYTLKAARRRLRASPARRPREVAAGQEAKADLKLTKMRNLSAHLTNAEWLISMPGTEEQKKFLLNCIGCHTLERIMKSSYDADGFLEVFNRMSDLLSRQHAAAAAAARRQFPARCATAATSKPIAEWLATVNLSQQDTWQCPLKTLPRLTGKSTHVIITEYDLPDAHIQPHDVILDSKGNVWYSDFGQMFLGKMDTKTGKVTQYPIPVIKPGLAARHARSRNRPRRQYLARRDVPGADREVRQEDREIQDVVDPEGMGYRRRAVRPSRGRTAPMSTARSGSRTPTAPTSTGSISRPTSGRTSARRRIRAPAAHRHLRHPFRRANNDAYLLDFSAGNIVKIDAKTKDDDRLPDADAELAPRRGRVDREGRLWFAEYRGDRIGMFDPKTGADHGMEGADPLERAL